MIYLDSSALLKLLVEEAESAALETWILVRCDVPVISSALVRLEVVRAIRRIEPGALPAARSLLTGLDLIPITGDLLESAADIGEPVLRSLEAIHLASALTVQDALTQFVAYDQRLLAAAVTAGLPVVSPS